MLGNDIPREDCVGVNIGLTLAQKIGGNSFFIQKLAAFTFAHGALKLKAMRGGDARGVRE
jgi:hypothetical protein